MRLGRWKEFWRYGVLLGIESTRLGIIGHPPESVSMKKHFSISHIR
jgi:hypothetical protein